MASLKGSQTEKNLLAAFAGESQARNRYTFASGVARKEGYEQISALFIETADNEKEHAQVFWKHLEGGDVEITAGYPAGTTGDTLANLRAAAAGEKMEWGTLYPSFAETAQAEGFGVVAVAFTEIGKVEAYHERRYNQLAERMTESQIFSRYEPIKWKCRNCGYVVEGAAAPLVCPACQHAQAYYEPWMENY
jgi:rubrerythrin